MTKTIICPQCGTSLPENTRFCSECGYPIQPEYIIGAAPGGRAVIPPTQKMDDYPDYAPLAAAPLAAAPQPTPVYEAAASPYSDEDYNAPAAQRSRSRPLLIGAGVLLGICCLGAAGFSLLAAFFGDGFEISLFSSPTPTATLTATPTNTPIPTNTPAPPPPTLPPTLPPSEPTVSRLQSLTDDDFFDDFSTTDLGWYVTEDGSSKTGYESDGYVIEVKSSDYRQLSRPPLTPLTHIEFNAQVLNGADNGAFGVACYYVDIQNYSYAEFYLPSREYRLGHIQNGEWVQKTEWTGYAFASDPIKYGVDCTAGAMAVYINDTLMVEIPVNQPNAPGEMWLFSMSWSDASGGIKVLFDNVYGYIARQ